MRVPLSRWVVAAVVGAVVAAPAAAAPRHHAVSYGARLAACHRSLRADQRLAVVSATMRPIPSASRMALKIDLYERPLAGGRWSARTDVPGLGAWTSPSDRATDLFKYRQAVARLDVPFAYRFHVSFRWLDAQGGVVREAALTTRSCREPDLRPDLFISDVRARPAGSGVRYVVNVGNEGGTDARGVVVAATLPGETVSRTRRIGRVPVGGSARVVFRGLGCPAGGPPPTFTADPAGTVDEADETNNAYALTCPVP
jgi:uncharacterized repeat protein (TIGR01451 family)